MKNSFKYPISKILGLYFVWWIVLSLLQTFVLHRFGYTWKTSLIDSFASNVILAFFCYGAMIIFYYYQPGKGNVFSRVGPVLGIAYFNNVTIRWTLKYLFVSDADYLLFIDKSMPLRGIVALLILSFVTLFFWMWNNMKEQKEKEQRQNDAEQLVKEAELAKLRQQLQPHFLFNSLNSISALAGSKPAEARKMIQQLSDFLRGTLKKDGQSKITFKEEIEHLKLYLEIEKVRFGHRLQIEMNISDNTLMTEIPPLIIQPIVENAIKFGLYDTVDDITISLSSYIKENHLFIEVKNPFDAETQTANQGTGFGLSYIQRRLFLLYSRNDLLSTEKKDNQFITTLKIPQSV